MNTVVMSGADGNNLSNENIHKCCSLQCCSRLHLIPQNYSQKAAISPFFCNPVQLIFNLILLDQSSQLSLLLMSQVSSFNGAEEEKILHRPSIVVIGDAARNRMVILGFCQASCDVLCAEMLTGKKYVFTDTFSSQHTHLNA